MKWGNEKNVEAPQAIVAMNDGRQNQVPTSPRQRLTAAQNREPEVQVLVVLAKNDFSWTDAVHLKDPEPTRATYRIQ
jgi:hypothetical protein